MLLLLAAAAMATTAPVSSLPEAAHALEAGRLDEADMLISASIQAGAAGNRVEVLVAGLAFARGDYAKAADLYRALHTAQPRDAFIAERAGIASLHAARLNDAERILDEATALPGASWRSWNARGVAADERQDWAKADASFAQALSLAPARAEISNNEGWSLLLRGRWREGEAALARAAVLNPTLPRVSNNFELARAALANEFLDRRPGEKVTAWAARLNDAGVAAAVQGQRARAIALFAQAIQALPTWDRRTAANLASVETSR